MSTTTRTVVIASESGLHARPAKIFAQAAKDSGIKVTIAKGDGKPANAASILGVMSIGAIQGDAVRLSAEGEGEAVDAVLDTLADILTTDHDAK